MVRTDSFSCVSNTFNQVKNEQTLCPETLARPFSTNYFLGLSKISSLLSSKNRHNISEPIFEKSTKFWVLLTTFNSHYLLSSDWNTGEYFVRRLSWQELEEWQFRCIYWKTKTKSNSTFCRVNFTLQADVWTRVPTFSFGSQ